MKIIDRAKALLNIEKRAGGVFISRPVLNGDEWAAWAEKWKVPSPLGAADLHVTIMASTVDVKMKPATGPVVVDMNWACFCLMGPESQALTVAFDDWGLQDRHWALQRNGAVSSWPTYRPHMTLTMANGDFELPDEALADAPNYIVLGGEVNADLKVTEVTEDDSDPEGVEIDDGDADLVVVIEIAASAAKTLLETAKSLNAVDATALRDVAAGRSITAGVAKRLASEAWATEEIRDLAKAPKKKPYGDVAYADAKNSKYPIDTEEHIRAAWSYINMPKNQADYTAAEVKAIKGKIVSAWKDKIDAKGPPSAVKKTVEREVVVTMKALPADVLKSMGIQKLDILDDEQRIVKGLASVSTIGGVLVEDLQDDTVTTQALFEFNRSLLSGQRAGKFEHEGDVRTEIVGGLVLSDDWQKALGIDLGFEPYLTDIHVPGDQDWAEVKKGDWMLSIAGTMYVEVEEGAES